MCNRYLSRKWNPEAAGLTAAAAETLARVTSPAATINDLRDVTFVRQMVAASKAAKLLRAAETRADRRARNLRIARRAAKIVNVYNDLRGTDVYARHDEARWLLVRLNRLVEEAILTRDLRAAYADNLDSDRALAVAGYTTAGADGLTADVRDGYADLAGSPVRYPDASPAL